jgi:hypothetical protein
MYALNCSYDGKKGDDDNNDVHDTSQAPNILQSPSVDQTYHDKRLQEVDGDTNNIGNDDDK